MAVSKRMLAAVVLAAAVVAVVGQALPATAAVTNPGGVTIQILEAGSSRVDPKNVDICIFTGKVRVSVPGGKGVKRIRARFQLYSAGPGGGVLAYASTPTFNSKPIGSGAAYEDFRGTIRTSSNAGLYNYRVTGIGDRDFPKRDLILKKYTIGPKLSGCGDDAAGKKKATPTTDPPPTEPPATEPPPTEPPRADPPRADPPPFEPGAGGSSISTG